MNDRQKPFLLKRPPVIVAILVVLAGLGWFTVHQLHKRAAAQGSYIFAAVEKGDIEDLVTATGTLQPRDSVDVGAQVSGQIEKLYVDVGDVVKKDQILADIDATQSQARVDADKANMEAQQSQLANSENSLEKAKRDYQRQLNLKKEDATTEQAVLDAKTTLDAAQHSIDTLNAQIKQQKYNMQVELSQLKYTKIVAPIDGTVVSLAVKQGQTINAAQSAPTILTIANLGVMTVQTQVSEADVTKLSKGMNAYFTTLGGSTRRYYGTVKRIEPTPKVQQSVVLYNVLFDVDNEGNQLLPSMTAQVFFVRAQARNVLLVPMAALQQGQQIAREMAAKDKSKSGDSKVASATATPGAAPPGATRPGANAPAGAKAAAPGTTAQTGATPGAGAAGGAGGPPGAGGNGGGQRPGGFGGFNGGQALSPEQIEQFRRMREQRMAQGGGTGGPGGGRPGGFGGGGFPGGNPAGGFSGANSRAQQRSGVVMVKLADGKLEQRQVVVGVNDRIRGQVISGLKEGEEVVVGRHEDEAAAAPSNQNQNRNNNNRGNNFSGGGFPAGGGFRPF